jgi:hypothetical protein
MSRIAEYELLSATDSKQLTAKVKERIAEGWEPYGTPFGLKGALFQAVVRSAKRIRKTSED